MTIQTLLEKFQSILREDLNLLIVGGVVLAAWLLISFSPRLLSRWAERLPDHTRRHVLALIPGLRLLVLGLASVLVILNTVKITPENVVFLISAIGVALTVVFQDYVGSLIAGIVAIYERIYQPGDWVTIDGAYGVIESVGMRAVKIVTPDDTTITIPHGKLWRSNIANANNHQPTHMVVADFYAEPQHDRRAARQALLDVGLTSAYTQTQLPVTVVLQETPWGVHYRLKAYPIAGRDEFAFISDLAARGWEALTQINVSPARIPVTPLPEGASLA